MSLLGVHRTAHCKLKIPGSILPHRQPAIDPCQPPSPPTHSAPFNCSERGYVSIQSGRRVVPTELGATLVRGYQLIDPELCRPQVRAHVEKQLDMIAKVGRGQIRGSMGAPHATRRWQPGSAMRTGVAAFPPSQPCNWFALPDLPQRHLLSAPPPLPPSHAQGEADKEAVVAHCLEEFRSKFAFFVAHIARMDALFEASFSPLASSGKVLSKCGK